MILIKTQHLFNLYSPQIMLTNSKKKVVGKRKRKRKRKIQYN